MEIIRVPSDEYQRLFPTPWSRFNSVEFSELNKSKCNEIHYLVFKDTKYRLGIILGENNNNLLSPFSATYGGFSFNSKVHIRYYHEACDLLQDYIRKKGKDFILTLAPPIYDSTDNSKTLNALISIGAQILSVECNHHYELKLFENYYKLLDSKVRNKLINSLKGGLKFNVLNSSCRDDVERVYNVIDINHKEKGRPLRMSLQNVLDTIKIIPADFFVVTDSFENDVAAAQIFHTSKNIYQVVYWGDIPTFSHLKSMNFLAYKIFEHYHSMGVEYIDIGISSELGKPNFGLCEFKENIGCEATLRFTLKL